MRTTLPLLLLLGCKPPEEAIVADSCEGGETYTWVMTGMFYTRRDDNNNVAGFDLDDHVSDAGDDEGCGHADLEDPDGNEGIDNAFSGIVPALEATEAAAVEGLIQDSISQGELLLLFQLTGVDDPMNDDCASLSVYRGEGEPMIGTDGTILDSQSFSRSALPPNSTIEQVSIVDGRIEARGLEMVLPIQILDVALTFNIDDAAIQLDIAEDLSGVSGFFSGGVPVEDILVLTEEEDIGDITALVKTLVTGVADLFPDEDGVCQELSIAFEVEATTAFFYGD
jgi:hypothetical protein